MVVWPFLPLVGRCPDDAPEIPVERGRRDEPDLFRHVLHADIRLVDQLARFAHPHEVHVLNGRHVHLLLKYTPEMRLAHVALICQICDLKVVWIIFLHILDRALKLQADALPDRLPRFHAVKPRDLKQQRIGDSPDALPVMRTLLLHLLEDGAYHRHDHGILLRLDKKGLFADGLHDIPNLLCGFAPLP